MVEGQAVRDGHGRGVVKPHLSSDNGESRNGRVDGKTVVRTEELEQDDIDAVE